MESQQVIYFGKKYVKTMALARLKNLPWVKHCTTAGNIGLKYYPFG
jgi:hypothetical protein